MKIAIIDDEYNIRELIKKLISLLFSDIEIVGETSSVEEVKKNVINLCA